MSSIVFMDRNNEAIVRGNERAAMGCFTSDLFCGILESNIRYLRHIVPGFDLSRSFDLSFEEISRIRENFHTQIRVGMGKISFKGELWNAWPFVLNTAMAIGSPALQLFTKLHAQCETHMWIDGKDRDWAAEIIGQGLVSGLYRKNMGWESVMDLLRESNRGKVVTEYSVSDSWDWKNKKDPEAQCSPDTLADTFFHSYNVFDLNTYMREKEREAEQLVK